MYKLTITVNGVSKAYSMTGWRIGYLGATEDIATKIKNLQSHSTSNPSSISQKAAAAALRDSEDTIKEMVKKFKERRDKIVDGLNKIKGFSCRKPEGSFYCFCNIKDTGLDSMKLANKLLDEIKVVVIPGVVFGDDDYIRISYACNMEEIEEGLNRLKKLFG
jgi:aspartate aminotransferase